MPSPNNWPCKWVTGCCYNPRYKWIFLFSPRGLADDGGPVLQGFLQKKRVQWIDLIEACGFTIHEPQDTSHEPRATSHGLRLLVSQGPFWTPYHPLKKSPQIRGKNCCAFITSWFFSLRIRAKQNHPPHSPRFSGLFKKNKKKTPVQPFFVKKVNRPNLCFIGEAKCL